MVRYTFTIAIQFFKSDIKVVYKVLATTTGLFCFKSVVHRMKLIYYHSYDAKQN